MIDSSLSVKLFLLCCIPMRILLASTPYYLPKKYFPYLGILLFSIGVTFLYLYFTNSRLKASEGGGKTWWAQYRIIHGILYLLAAYLIFQGDRRAYIPLLLDVFIGTVLFVIKRKKIIFAL